MGGVSLMARREHTITIGAVDKPDLPAAEQLVRAFNGISDLYRASLVPSDSSAEEVQFIHVTGPAASTAELHQLTTRLLTEVALGYLTPARRRNPSSNERQEVKLFEDFHGSAPVRRTAFPVPLAPTAWRLGTLESVVYRAERDGETASYEHTFKRRAQPYLAVMADRLVLLGGRYDVTDRGIVDR